MVGQHHLHPLHSGLRCILLDSLPPPPDAQAVREGRDVHHREGERAIQEEDAVLHRDSPRDTHSPNPHRHTSRGNRGDRSQGQPYRALSQGDTPEHVTSARPHGPDARFPEDGL